MKSIRRRLLTASGAVTVGLVIALGVRPEPAGRIVSAYLLALAAIGTLALIRLTVAAAHAEPQAVFERALERGEPGRGRPPELVRIEREITLGSASAPHLHRRLAPLLREAAATRLWAHDQIEIERSPEEARKLLGDDAWEVVRPDLPRPPDGEGLPLRRIRSIVETLERL